MKMPVAKRTAPKSIHTRQAIEIRPLTILAGANGSGKSSMMQTLLLLKQTLEAPYDPGPLLIYGPNVKFSQVKQMFFHSAGTSKSQMIEIELHFDGTELRLSYSGKRRRGYGPPELVAQTEGTVHGEITLNEHSGSEDAIKQFKDNTYWNPIISAKGMNQAEVIRNRCFLEARLSPPGDLPVMKEIIHFFPGRPLISHLKEIIHVPGLRGNPERAYPVTAIGETFPGTFEDYAASCDRPLGRAVGLESRPTRRSFGPSGTDLEGPRAGCRRYSSRVAQSDG